MCLWGRVHNEMPRRCWLTDRAQTKGIEAQMSTTTVTQTVDLYSALHTAIEQRGALVILYNTGGKVERARAIYPEQIRVGKESDLVRAYDSIRKMVLTFRLDRIAAYHAFGERAVS
jgi:predicted DNA-binding transcriptional regulator YafY